MAKLSALVARTCTVDVYPDEPGLLTVDYRPSRYQQEFLKELELITGDPNASDADKLKANTMWIMQMCPAWNAEEEDSTEKARRYSPVTEEAVKSLGLLVQTAIIQAIQADIKLGE